ncbi:MAG: hypothetical protein MZV65_00625 [Chromatiales bacterium]|nr:hypothetical protein [Chromatiales bacterium]
MDEGRYDEAELSQTRNTVAALFRLEFSRDPGVIMEVLGALIDWVGQPDQAGLRRALTSWVVRVLKIGQIPGVDLDKLQDLSEVKDMLAERVKDWTQGWKQEGLELGRQEGRQEEALLILRRPAHAALRYLAWLGRGALEGGRNRRSGTVGGACPDGFDIGRRVRATGLIERDYPARPRSRFQTERENAERPITAVEGTHPAGIVAQAEKILRAEGKRVRRPQLWDGRAAGWIVQTLAKSCAGYEGFLWQQPGAGEPPPPPVRRLAASVLPGPTRPRLLP